MKVEVGQNVYEVILGEENYEVITHIVAAVNTRNVKLNSKNGPKSYSIKNMINGIYIDKSDAEAICRKCNEKLEEQRVRNKEREELHRKEIEDTKKKFSDWKTSVRHSTEVGNCRFLCFSTLNKYGKLITALVTSERKEDEGPYFRVSCANAYESDSGYASLVTTHFPPYGTFEEAMWEVLNHLYQTRATY